MMVLFFTLAGISAIVLLLALVVREKFREEGIDSKSWDIIVKIAYALTIIGWFGFLTSY